MEAQVSTELRAQTLTKPCLLLGVSRHLLCCIAGEVTELAAIGIHRQLALSEGT